MCSATFFQTLFATLLVSIIHLNWDSLPFQVTGGTKKLSLEQLSSRLENRQFIAGYTHNWPTHSHWGTIWHPEHVFGLWDVLERLDKTQRNTERRWKLHKDITKTPVCCPINSWFRWTNTYPRWMEHSPPRTALSVKGTGTRRWWRERWGSDMPEQWETCRRQKCSKCSSWLIKVEFSRSHARKSSKPSGFTHNDIWNIT